MGFGTAIVHGYGHMLNFTGRASRSEYWWFVLWTIIASVAMGVGLGYYLSANPALLYELQVGGPETEAYFRTYGLYYLVANFVLFWLPNLSLIIRRLHDTDRSGAWYLIQFVPIIGAIWLLVLLCLNGTYGTNRFGPDSAPDRKRPTPSHPAFAGELKGEARARAEIERKEAAHEYYQRHVLPSLQRS